MMQKVGIAGLTKKAEIMGEQEAYDKLGVGGVNPNSPAYKAEQDRIKQKNELVGTERNLANDFQKYASDYKYKEEGLKALTQAYLDNSGTSDFELIRRGAQMVEPGLAVRADDQQSLIGAASALGMTEQAIKAIVSGETKLDPKVRSGIMRIAQRAYDSSLDRYNTVRDNFLTRAEQAGVNKRNVVPFDPGKPFKDLYPDLDIGTGLQKQSGNVITAPDGRLIEIVD
jgi:hypothetical protein